MFMLAEKWLKLVCWIEVIASPLRVDRISLAAQLLTA